MFRIKKEPGEDAPISLAKEPRGLELDPSAAKVPPRRAFEMPPRAAGGPGFHPDIPRRTPEIAPPGGTRELRGPAAADKKSLIVGHEVKLKGQVESCERMVVEGIVEASVTGARSLEIGSTGLFLGTAEVAEAVVSGRFEGELTVCERLTVRPSGRVQGRVRYARLIIEEGGEVIGQIESLATDRTQSSTDHPAQSPAMAGNTGTGRHGDGRSDADTGSPLAEPVAAEET
jgi:cytoskeletal protein CcmA (bactofilin family)